jgi:hypothetical protein
MEVSSARTKPILGSGERLLFHFSAKMSLPEVVRAFSDKVAVLRVVQLEMVFTSVPPFGRGVVQNRKLYYEISRRDSAAISRCR